MSEDNKSTSEDPALAAALIFEVNCVIAMTHTAVPQVDVPPPTPTAPPSPEPNHQRDVWFGPESLTSSLVHPAASSSPAAQKNMFTANKHLWTKKRCARECARSEQTKRRHGYTCVLLVMELSGAAV